MLSPVATPRSMSKQLYVLMSDNKMKILLVHNTYQIPGGEDEVHRRERALLLSRGHQVVDYVRGNDEIKRYRWWEKAALPARAIWALNSYAEIRGILKRSKCDVAHFHNTFPLISPAAYYACREAGVPVIQSLHNPRLVCPAATFERDHRVCQDCLGRKFAWPSVLHGCYRESRTQTSIVAAMLAIHRQLKTWEKLVDRYIVFTEFYRRKFVEAGLPPEKIVIKPHFVEDHGVRQNVGSYALFVGRLAPVKGVDTLIEAWRGLREIPLMIRGEGPLSHKVQQLARESGGTVRLLPRLNQDELAGLMQGARFLVWPSEGYYETFGCVAAEAFSCGVPVLASRTGMMQEIVTDGCTGLHFNPGNSEDLAAKVKWAWTHQEEMAVMGHAARAEYDAKYTAESNYKMLIRIYEQAIATHRAS
jgi:glycosyltransferase involved in cell wall biosynthesis